MTATQVFMLFLKETCTIDELRFFKHIIMQNHGNKYFSKRPLFKPTFVEDYLARNNRCLNNYMTRLFVLAPNLNNERHKNPRWGIIWKGYNERNEGKSVLRTFQDWDGLERTVSVPCEFRRFNCGMYINYYKRKWNQFLREKIESEKKFNSPFKKGETYDFKLKE